MDSFPTEREEEKTGPTRYLCEPQDRKPVSFPRGEIALHRYTSLCYSIQVSYSSVFIECAWGNSSWLKPCLWTLDDLASKVVYELDAISSEKRTERDGRPSSVFNKEGSRTGQAKEWENDGNTNKRHLRNMTSVKRICFSIIDLLTSSTQRILFDEV